ncbi:MAG: GntR family transcriptional regulator [Lachnospiraceae bacterium]|nr:GntR family transcriptional regulator [Lachnospiraceae bacterium]
MIIIDYKDTRPIYEQITEKFKTLILKGVLQPDEQMPSVRSLAMELSINPNTIQKAYAQLEWEGYIYPVKGRGNFVAGTEKLLEERKKSCIEKILMLSEEAAEYGISREEIISEIMRHNPKTAGNEEEGKIHD